MIRKLIEAMACRAFGHRLSFYGQGFTGKGGVATCSRCLRAMEAEGRG